MRLQDAFAEYAGSQAHNGFQAFVHAAERRNAVKRQSGTTPVAARFGDIQDGGRICEAFFAFQAFTRQIKGFKLHFGHAVVGLVGAGEVAEFDDAGDVFALFQGSVGGSVIVREEAGTVHTGIHFEPDFNGVLPVMGD